MTDLQTTAPERWDVLDANGQPVGRTHVRSEARPTGDYHVVVDIWTVNTQNEILLTQRHPDKRPYPHCWENTAGSVLAGETSRQGAARELFEETGLRVSAEALFLLDTYRDHNTFWDTYVLRKDAALSEMTMQPGETAAARWATAAVLDAGDAFAPPVLKRLARYRDAFDAFLLTNKRRYASKSAVLFDLDGTLTDSAVGIVRSLAYALDQCNARAVDETTLRSFLGTPLRDVFTRHLGFDEAQTDEAVAHYRQYYESKGIYENKLYPGIPDLLSRLHTQGKIVALATVKPTHYAQQVVDHFGLAPYFTMQKANGETVSTVVSSEMDGQRGQKDEVIAYALAHCGVCAADAVMVGDRAHDILGAQKNTLDVIGVLYGYGSYAELQEASCLVRDTEALAGLLL